MKGSDRMWYTGEGNGKPLRFSCLENPINSMKRQKEITPEYVPSRLEVSSMLLRKSRGQLLIAPERMKRLDQSRNDTQLWMCLVVKVKSNAVKYNIA